MRKLLRWSLLAVPLLLASGVSEAAEVGAGKSYKGPTGLQLYSLRDMMKTQGLAVTLDKTKAYGFKYVEVADYGVVADVLDIVPALTEALREPASTFSIPRANHPKQTQQMKTRWFCAWSTAK